MKRLFLAILCGLLLVAESAGAGDKVIGNLEVSGDVTMGTSLQLGSFWRGCPQNVLQNGLKKVSIFGDSIVAGSFNLPNESRVWTPQYAQNILIQRFPPVTIDGNLFSLTSPIMSSGVTVSGAAFILTGGTDVNPRFAMTQADAVTINAGDVYLVTGQIDSTNSVGYGLTMRYYGTDAGGAITAAGNVLFGGDDVSTNGYLTVSTLVSGDWLKITDASIVKMLVGGQILATASAGVGKIQNIQIYRVIRGICIVNQGFSGYDTSMALNLLGVVTPWTPHVVVIAFGTNDIRNVHDLSLYLSNLAAIVNDVKTIGAHPVLASIPPLASDQPNFADVPAWNAAVATLAAQLNCGFWDRYAVLGLSDIADGRHPTRLGYEKLGADLAHQFERVIY